MSLQSQSYSLNAKNDTWRRVKARKLVWKNLKVPWVKFSTPKLGYFAILNNKCMVHTDGNF